jgi:hypothetical protein
VICARDVILTGVEQDEEEERVFPTMAHGSNVMEDL